MSSCVLGFTTEYVIFMVLPSISKFVFYRVSLSVCAYWVSINFWNLSSFLKIYRVSHTFVCYRVSICQNLTEYRNFLRLIEYQPQSFCRVSQNFCIPSIKIQNSYRVSIFWDLSSMKFLLPRFSWIQLHRVSWQQSYRVSPAHDLSSMVWQKGYRVWNPLRLSSFSIMPKLSSISYWQGCQISTCANYTLSLIE